MQIQENRIIGNIQKVFKAILLGFYLILLIGLIASGISMGIITMMPDEASKSCFLGYYAHCSFTPFSTLILFALTTIGLILLIKLINHYRRRIPRIK